MARVALVTGGMGGLGEAVCIKLAALGYQVVTTFSPGNTKVDAWLGAMKEQGFNFKAYACDVADYDAAQECVRQVIADVGPIDVLVNNAGIYEFAPLEHITVEHFRKQFDLNVLGLLLTTQEAVKHFGSGGGSIVNISSVAATAGLPGAAVYGGTKAAVDAATKSLAKELGPRKIRVNSVNPGMVETEGVHATGIAESDFRKQVEAQTPLGRIGQPQDIAPAVVFLASPDAGWITGETLFISGGNR